MSAPLHERNGALGGLEGICFFMESLHFEPFQSNANKNRMERFRSTTKHPLTTPNNSNFINSSHLLKHQIFDNELGMTDEANRKPAYDVGSMWGTPACAS
jgi:hypothetical protein